MTTMTDRKAAEAQAQGGGDVCETCDGAGHVVTYADPYDRGDVSSPEQSPCPACTTPPSGGLCVERTCDPDFPQWDAVKRLIEPAPPSAPVGVDDDDDDSEMVERVARAIATEGFGRPWDDFHELYVHDTDKSDLREYARAAISAFAQQPAAVDVEALREVADYMAARAKWEACDCGCPNAKRPVDAASVAWIRAAAMVRAALRPAAAQEDK